MTKHYAVLGSPISQSKSPALHSAAFRTLGIDADYGRYELASGLPEFLESTGAGLSGVSVTMPLKEEAFAFASNLDELAVQSKSCNTLVRVADQWSGFNTDVYGLLRALREVSAGRTLIIGSGATSRSAFAACVLRGDDVSTWARSPSNLSDQQLAVFDAGALFATAEFDLVISTIPSKSLDDHLSLDAKPPTVFLSAAYTNLGELHSAWLRACTSISGLEMLLWQAVAQQAIFAGTEIENFESNEALITAMRESLREAVGE